MNGFIRREPLVALSVGAVVFVFLASAAFGFIFLPFPAA